MKPKALMIPKRVSDTVLSTDSSSILAKMDGNDNYSGTVIVALRAAAQDARNAYIAALDIAKDGTRSQIAEKNDRKAELITAMNNICDFVNYATPGEYAILLTTGFKISTGVREARILQALLSFTVVKGENPCSLFLSAKKGENTNYVLFEYALTDAPGANTTWTSCPGTESSCTISNLPFGAPVAVRAAAVGSRKQIIYNVPIQTVVS